MPSILGKRSSFSVKGAQLIIINRVFEWPVIEEIAATVVQNLHGQHAAQVFWMAAFTLI